MSVAGLLLAAGAGRRRGGPKALAVDPDGTSWLQRSVAALRDGGCAPVTVVLGAGADQALALVDDDCDVVVADDWAAGMGASLRAGLRSLCHVESDLVLVSLVDLPDVGPDVVARMVTTAGPPDQPLGPAALARAAYGGDPRHPVLLGRDHWVAVAAEANGDRGARDYLAARDVRLVECGDLATGVDQDT